MFADTQYTHDTHAIPGDNSFNYEDIYLTVFVQIKLCYKTRFIWCFSVESRAIKLIAKSESVFPVYFVSEFGIGLPWLVTRSFLGRTLVLLARDQLGIWFVQRFFLVRRFAGHWRSVACASSCRLCRGCDGSWRDWLTLKIIKDCLLVN